MRNILVVTLALSPVLLHAQTPSIQAGAHAPVLESRLVSPKPADSAPAANVAPVTTSLVVPRLVKWSNIPLDRQRDDSMSNQERFVTVSMTVSEQGVPTQLKVVDSEDPLINRSVLDAVANYRFSPASFNSKPTAMPLVLTVRVLPPTN